MQHSGLAKRAWLFLFAAIAAFYFWGLGSLPLIGSDEPRYAEVAREMLARRDLITPTLGGIPWFEKPPLLYWMTMLSYRVLGVSEYAARLGPAICGLLTAGFVYWMGRCVQENVFPTEPAAAENCRHDQSYQASALARWSALVWLTSLGVIVFSRAASFDIVLTMTVTGALACFFVNEVRTRSGPGSPNGQPSWGGGSDGASLKIKASRASLPLLGLYLFIGLSLLAKGLIGFVIIFGVVALYYLIRRERPERTFSTSLFWGVPLSLVVAGVWYGPMIQRHGWAFIDQFIVQHHFARFVTNKYHHPGPWYFYLPVIVGLALPWTIVLGAALFSARRLNWRGRAPLDRTRTFAIAWVILPVVFFSFSGAKLIAYILPVLPAVALLVGERIVCFIKEGRGAKVLRLTGALLIALAMASGWYLHRQFSLNIGCAGLVSMPFLLAGIAVLVRPQLRTPLFILIAIATLATSAVALKCAAPNAIRAASVRDLLTAAAARGYATTPVAQLHTVERTAEFYAANRISYGSDGEPVKFEGAAQVLEAARRSGGVILCFVPIEYESQLTAHNLAQTDVIADNGRVALLVVQVK